MTSTDIIATIMIALLPAALWLGIPALFDLFDVLAKWAREAYMVKWDETTGEIRWCIGNREAAARDIAAQR